MLKQQALSPSISAGSQPFLALCNSLHGVQEVNWKSTGPSDVTILSDLGLLSLMGAPIDILKLLRPPAAKKSPLGSSFLPLTSCLARAFQVEGEGAESELGMRASLP